MSGTRRGRQTVNYVTLATPLGLLVAKWGRASLSRGPDGLWLATSYRRTLKPRAFTVGNVVITRHDRAWLDEQPRLVVHEGKHATQWACWLGLPYLPAYGVATLWSRWRTGDRGLGNVFEIRAGLADGGYDVRKLRRPPTA